MHEGLASTAAQAHAPSAAQAQAPADRRRPIRFVAGLVCAAALVGAAWPEHLSASTTLAWTGVRATVAELGAHEAWTLTLFGVGMFIAGRTLRRPHADQ